MELKLIILIIFLIVINKKGKTNKSSKPYLNGSLGKK